MAEDIKVPGLGSAPKKYVIGGVLVAAGVGVIVFVRARSAAKTAAATAATTDTSAGQVTDPAGNQCAAVDPNSGYCPGSPEDTAWQENNSGYYGSSLGDDEGADLGETGGTSTAGLTYVTDPAGNQCTAVDPSTGYCPGTPQDVAAQGGLLGGNPVAPIVATNSDWLQAALQVLPGGDSSANEAALAGVLGGLTVTTAQKSIFLEAVGLEGQPPQGYPTPIKTSDTAAQPGTSTSAGAISNLTVTASGTSVTARWNPAKNATQGYKWNLTGPTSHSGSTKSTTATITGLKAGTYNFGIQALPGGPGNNEHVTVK